MDVSASIIGIVSLSIQVTGVLDKFIQDWKDVPANIRSFREELDLHTQFFKKLEVVWRDPASCAKYVTSAGGEMGDIVTSCKADLDRLADILIISPKCSLRKKSERLKKTLRSDSLNQSMAKLHRRCEQINQLVLVDGYAAALESRAELRQVAVHQSKAYQAKILRWLTPFVNTKRHEDLLQQCHPGTCDWIFDDDAFLDWSTGFFNPPDDVMVGLPSPRVLWYYGIPGVGKSVMMSQVVQYLEAQTTDDVAVLYLYCDYKDREHQTLLDLVSSLLKQATSKLAASTEFPREVVDAYQRYAEGESGRLSCDEAQRYLKVLLKGFRRSFILLDGLDECVHSGGESKITKPNELLEAVQQVITTCDATCRLFLTSRENIMIRHENILATRLPLKARDSDIRSFVESYIRSDKFDLADQVNENDSLRIDIIERITEKVQGQFLLASFHVKDLDDQPSIRDLRERLEDLPINHLEQYELTLERIKAQGKTRGKSGALGFKLMGFVLHAFHTLTVQEIQHALAVRSADKFFSAEGIIDTKTMISHAAGLLVIKGDKVEFVHNSLFEYLRFSSIFAEEFSKVEEDLAQACMTYISLQDFAEPCVNLQERYQQFPFLKYSARYFGRHATSSLKRNPDLLPGYLKFLQSNIPLGSLQVFAVKVLQIPVPGRMETWRDNLTQLHLAIVVGLVAVVQVMIDQGADIEEAAYKNETPLHMAARSCDLPATELLLNRGADVTKINYSGKNALDMIMNEPYFRVQLKLSEENFLECLVTSLFLRFLHGIIEPETEIERKIAAELLNGNMKEGLLRTLSRQNTDREHNRRTTEVVLASDLEMSVSDEQAELAHRLIDAEIDLNCQGATLGTPLQLAVIYRRKDLVEHLLDKGANPFLDHDLGYSALELAQQRKETDTSSDIIELISKKMQKAEELEAAELNQAKKTRIAGPFQASEILRKSRETALERNRRLVSYMPKFGTDPGTAPALVLHLCIFHRHQTGNSAEDSMPDTAVQNANLEQTPTDDVKLETPGLSNDDSTLSEEERPAPDTPLPPFPEPEAFLESGLASMGTEMDMDWSH